VARSLLWLSLSLLLASCDMVSTLKDGLAQSEAMAADLDKATGSKPFVGFNWNNGKLTSVSVTYEGLPKGMALPDLAAQARAAAAKHFKQEPGQLVLAFSIGKQ
jgi:hypothetical protein